MKDSGPSPSYKEQKDRMEIPQNNKENRLSDLELVL